jgi:hypothetical protein
MVRRALPLALLLAALLAIPASSQTITRIDVPRALAEQVDRINARGHGPVLLPSRLRSEQARLYASGTSSRRGWVLELGAAPDCGGANVCFGVRFLGELGGVPAGLAPVKLANGRRGWFTPTRCNASCAPPQMQWHERGHTYTIQARVGLLSTEKRAIVRLANSAIVNGPRR